jgi:DNA repair protein RadA/Sms
VSVAAVTVRLMGKLGAVAAYECSECGWRTPKWAGRCAECQTWGSLTQAPPAGLANATPGSTRVPLRAGTPRVAAVPIGQVDAAAARARPTGMDELDRVLGGGLVPGAVVLVAGEPGVGKSTLLLEAGALAARSGPVLYVTGEESAAQVRQRADRVGAISDNLFLAAETDFAALLAHVEAVNPTLLIVDSVQTISAAGLDGVPGGVTQVREITAALTALAKQRTLTTVLVGHVTKDGSVAGPRTLEHLVDVVLSFDGDSRGQLRMVRALKNRFGPTDEIGCFELGEDGLTGLADPSGLFLSQRHDPVPGTCVTVTLEGRRPLVAEVQTLVCATTGELARRVTSGLDTSRVGMVVAVLQRRAGISIGRQDVYAATVGGVRLTEPSVDLALALALASARSDTSVPGDLVAIGEVGLAGEIRRVGGVARRLAEAQRLGFRRAIVPPGSGFAAPGLAAPGGPAGGGGAGGGRVARIRLAGTEDRSPGRYADEVADTGIPEPWAPSIGVAGGGIDVREAPDIRTAIAFALGG